MLGLQLDYKEIPTQEFSCDTCEIMKNIFFTEYSDGCIYSWPTN